MNQEAMFFLMAKVHTPIGDFYGRLTINPSPLESAKKARDEFQANVHRFEYLVLFDGIHLINATETMLSAQVIAQSVFVFSLVPAEHLGWKPNPAAE